MNDILSIKVGHGKRGYRLTFNPASVFAVPLSKDSKVFN